MKQRSLNSQISIVGELVNASENKLAANVIAIISGVLLMAGLAQIAIPLPWTPVPITGQTFGVALTALCWGKNRAMAIMSIYLLMGTLGLPVFAMGSAATMGYLVGMAVASFVVGTLADKGWTNSFEKSLGAAYIGSFIIFAFGLAGLSFFLPAKSLLMAGLIPFLPGDAVKNLLAAAISYKCKKLLSK